LNSSTRSRGAEGLRCPALPPRRPDGRALLARCGKHRGVTTRSAPLVERPFAPRVPRFRQGWSFRVWCVKPCRPGLAGGWVDTRTGSVTRRWRLRRSATTPGSWSPHEASGSRSRVPARVSKSRCRSPLRRLTRSGVPARYWAPQTASPPRRAGF